MQTSRWLKWGGILLALAVPAAAVGARARSGPEPTRLRTLYQLQPPAWLVPARTALVLVDFQNEFVSGGLPLPEGGAAITRAAELADWARRCGILVVLVENVIERPGTPLFAAGAKNTELVPQLTPQPSDLVLKKSMAGAFSHTDFDHELRARGIDTLIVGGLMTHLAVLVTVIDASVLGYRVLIASDATATRTLPGAGGEPAVDAATLQRAALAAMADRFGDVLRGREITALPLVGSEPAATGARR
jgi:nicotinamidase-related amidase